MNAFKAFLYELWFLLLLFYSLTKSLFKLYLILNLKAIKSKLACSMKWSDNDKKIVKKKKQRALITCQPKMYHLE